VPDNYSTPTGIRVVDDAADGPYVQVAPATTALLHGMMGTLSEVLGGLDARITAMEQQVRESRAASGAVESALHQMLARLDDVAASVHDASSRPPEPDEHMRQSVAVLAGRVDAVGALAGQSLASLGERLDAVAAIINETAGRAPFVDEDLRAAVQQLAARPPFVDEDLRAAVQELAARPPAVDEELRAAVQHLAARPPFVDEDLRAAMQELGARPPFVDEALRAAVQDLAARPPAVDEELRAALQDLAARPPFVDEELRAAVHELAARPAPVDEQVHQALAVLAGLFERVEAVGVLAGTSAAGIEALAARPPHVDEELHAAVSALTERVEAVGHAAGTSAAGIAALASRPSHVDEDLHAAMAALTERVESIGSLVARTGPEVASELGAQLTALAAATDAAVAAAAAKAPAPSSPDDPVRVALTSLHERVGLLQEAVAQPPQPDDAVRQGLVALQAEMAGLKGEVGERMEAVHASVEAAAAAVAAAAAAPEPDDRADETAAVLRLALARLAELGESVDGLGDTVGRLTTERLAELHGAIQSLLAPVVSRLDEHAQAPALLSGVESQLQALTALATAAAERPEPEPAPTTVTVEVPPELQERLARMEEVLASAGYPAAQLHEALARLEQVLASTDQPAALVHDALARMEDQVASLVAQPGPGPAMAMVAAGLAERFESRTEAVVDLVRTLTREVTDLRGQVEEGAGQSQVHERMAELLAVAGSHAARTEELAAAQAAYAGHAEQLAEHAQHVAHSTDQMAHTTEQVALTTTELASQAQQLAGGQAAQIARIDDLAAEMARREDALATAVQQLRQAVHESGGSDTERQELLGALAGLLQSHQSDLDAVLQRLTSVVEGQQGDVSGVRDTLRHLSDVAERNGAVSSQVAELLLESRAAVRSEIDRLDEALHHVRSEVAAVAVAAATPSDDGGRLADIVHRESEMLTQRVASLSVAVDNLRGLLQVHMDDTANSIGRKATEVGRRLAADFGMRNGKKPAPAGGAAKAPSKSIGPAKKKV
jgi:chromosome segregation ATPase